MRGLISLVGVLLIIFGIVTLGYQGFTYTTRDKVAEIGNVQVTTEKEQTVYLSPAAGGISLVAGIVLVALTRVGRRRD